MVVWVIAVTSSGGKTKSRLAALLSAAGGSGVGPMSWGYPGAAGARWVAGRLASGRLVIE